MLGRVKDERRSARRGQEAAVLRILDVPCAPRLGGRARMRAKEDAMLRIYAVMIEVLEGLRPVVRAIERCDGDLARQLRRAATSVALNVSEGSGSAGGTRRERYRNALGSARETGACLDAAIALGYVDRVDAHLLDQLDHVGAVLVKNVR
ncbi:MAG TPA: four helix bundle protein [Acidimicrobiales bacterium]|nr:four helix bundle protein [Acidimicrobiales bacterium]